MNFVSNATNIFKGIVGGGEGGGGGLGSMVGNLIEEGTEKAGLAAGMSPEQAERLGDLARLGYNLKTGNYADILAEADDLANKEGPVEVQVKGGGSTSGTHGGYTLVNGHWERGGANGGTEIRDHRKPSDSPAPLAGDFTDYFRSTAGPLPRTESLTDWKEWLMSANGDDISRAIQEGKIPDAVLNNPGISLMVGEKMKAFDRLLSMIKSVLDAKHETSKNATQFRV